MRLVPFTSGLSGRHEEESEGSRTSSGTEAGAEGVAPGMFLAEAKVEQSTFGWSLDGVKLGVRIMREGGFR